MIFGRKNELSLLSRTYNDRKSSLILVYGRRRIGKTFLVHQHLAKHSHFYFEGVERQSSKYHINLLSDRLQSRIPSSMLPDKPCASWEDILDLFTLYIQSRSDKKTIIFLDEYQWICVGRSRLTSLIKEYWDNQWKKHNVQLILCGSISSFMVKKVIKSKALYGRINAELNIQQLIPSEANLFFRNNKSNLERLKYLLIFGGIPKYLEDIDHNVSINKNIAQFFFDKHSTYINEYEKIFYSQFREPQVYEKIVGFLAQGPSTLHGISSAISFSSGGGLKSYLENLQKAQFIDSYYSSPNKLKSKILTYKLIDPFLRFYLTFVFPNRNLILKSSDSVNVMQRLTKNRLNAFLGFAFENFCQLFALDLANKMGFEDEVISFGSFFEKSGDPFQIDLLYFRENKAITICEIKYSEEEISPSVISEVENKLNKLKKLYPNHSINKALICSSGATKALMASQYFEHILETKKILTP